MYFSKFPTTLYSLDDIKTVQLVTNIMTRAVISEEISNNLSLFEDYIIKDGETPDMLADMFYDNPQYHWVILHCNNIFDMWYKWPLSTNNLVKYVEGKYPSRDATHHYENDDGIEVSGNLYINSNVEFTSITPNNILINKTSDGIAVVTSKINNSNVIITVSSGGFRAGDVIQVFDNANITANITSTFSIGCDPITVFMYEDRVNEANRNIRILKKQYVGAVVSEFDAKMSV